MSTSGTAIERVGADLRVGVRPLGGLVYGVVAYAVGFVVTVALFAWAVAQEGGVTLGDVTAGGTIEGSAQSFLAVLGWLFFTSHGVAVRRTTGSETAVVDVFGALRIENALVFHLVPAVLLGLAGFVVAHRATGELSVVSSTLAGASVVVGYGLLVAAGAVAFVVESGGATYRPAPVGALLLAGLAYPVVCGGLGGLVRELLGRSLRG
jgi:hypothetical protein